MKKSVLNFSVVAVVALSAVLVTSCKDNDTELPEDVAELPSVQRKLGNGQLVSLAVGRVFDKTYLKNPFTESGVFVKRLNVAESYIKYPFDAVKIINAVRYSAPEVDFPFLNEICGDGEIEIFHTPFITYINEGDAGDMQPHIADTQLVFRGETGIYSCMLNSGSYGSDVFSSHKRFADNAIEKDFTPPLYEFGLKTDRSGQTVLGCRVVAEKNGNITNQPFQWTQLQGGEFISGEDLYALTELLDMPEVSQQCMITETGEGYFLVSGQKNLEKICFDAQTLFFVDEKSAKATDFAKGDLITVSFDRLYERYNPKVAVANSIVK